MKHILFKKLSYNITRIALSVLASIAVMTVVAYAASTVGTNFSADGTLSVTATSTLSSDLRVDTNTLVVDSFNDRVGIGTTSPYAKLSVAGEVVGGYFTATTTTATSTFAGGLAVETSGLVYDYTTNNVGINTVSPAQKLDVNGFINTNGTVGGYRIDNNLILQASTTNYSTLVGYQAGNALLADGLYNTFIGYQAGLTATSTDRNTAVGYLALKGSATISTARNNTAMGYLALYLTSGTDNTAIGDISMYQNTTGNENTAIGKQSLSANTTGSSNVASGFLSLSSNTSGSTNTAYGYDSLRANTTGVANVGLGYRTGWGDNSYADQRSVTDNYMTFLGYQASRDSSVASTTTLGNGTAIGKNAKVGMSNAIILGGTGSDAVNVGIGTSTPQKRLVVSSGSSATTTVQIGDVYSGTSKTCFEALTNAGSIISFYFVSTTMVVEANACR